MNVPSLVTVSDWLASSESRLYEAGIESARLDAMVLLSDELKKDKSWLLAYSDYELQGSELVRLNTKLTQRALHTPLAYIRGHVEFYGRTFIVNPFVLVPRPESEAFFELLNTLDSGSYTSIIDVGTGSGALAISAALLANSHDIFATDTSKQALLVANNNAQKHTVTITFSLGNLLDPIADEVLANSVLVCNLPYVPTTYTINKAATHEPEIALFSGQDGLDHYKELVEQITARTVKPRYILTESLLSQRTAVQEILGSSGYKQQSTIGLVQLFTRG